MTAAAASAQTPLPDCSTGTRTLSSGSYFLDRSMTPPAGQSCFSIRRTSNITIDGRKSQGFMINAAGTDAIRIDDVGTPTSNNITIRNFKTNGSIYINSHSYNDSVASGHHITIEDSEFSGLLAYETDNFTIQRNHARSLSVNYLSNDGVKDLTVLSNTLYESTNPGDGIHYKSGTPTSQLVYLVCTKTSLPALTNMRFEGNTVGSIYDNSVHGNPGSHPLALTVRGCRGASVKDNVITATGGDTYGIYLRDFTADGQFLNNRISTRFGGALHSGSGSYPGTVSNNLFADNTFYSTGGSAFELQNLGTGNSFERNSIVSSDGLGGNYSTMSGKRTTFRNNTFVNLTTQPAAAWSAYGSSVSSEGADIHRNNIYSVIGTSILSLEGYANQDHDSNPATPAISSFYVSHYDGNYNLFNSRNGLTPSRERGVDDLQSRDIPGMIFQSLDPANPLFLRLVPNSNAALDPCRSGEGGTHVGRYPCSSDVLPPAAPSGLRLG